MTSSPLSLATVGNGFPSPAGSGAMTSMRALVAAMVRSRDASTRILAPAEHSLLPCSSIPADLGRPNLLARAVVRAVLPGSGAAPGLRLGVWWLLCFTHQLFPREQRPSWGVPVVRNQALRCLRLILEAMMGTCTGGEGACRAKGVNSDGKSGKCIKVSCFQVGAWESAELPSHRDARVLPWKSLWAGTAP